MVLALRRRAESRPVALGGIAGLLVGLAGLLLLGDDRISYAGGMLGAVAGGVTAAALSRSGLGTDVYRAVAADALSSVLFYVGAIGWLVTDVSGVAYAPLQAAVLAVGMALLGSFVAVPVALVSLCVAALAGAVTSAALDSGTDEAEPFGTSRK